MESEPADQQFAFVYDFGRKLVVEFDEQLFMTGDLGFPRLAVEMLQLFEIVFGEVEALPIQVGIGGHPANRRFLARGAAV